MKILTEKEAITLTRPLIYTLVTSLNKKGRPNALGVSWVMRTSIKPLLMAISIDRRRYSHRNIQLHKEFVINYPNKDQARSAWICGVKSGRSIDKIKLAKITLVKSKKVKVPTIHDATVAFECKLIDKFKTGDHTIFVGKVLAMTGNPKKSKHLFVACDWRLIGLDKKGKSKLNLTKGTI
ncbi:MAG: flavin reductase family protein [Candidatus Omnitrophica bacterium]|nr:flavin reductase family protein [Candidatus Omnitrophota bacterium]